MSDAANVAPRESYPASDYADLVDKLHEQAEWYSDGHGPLHAAAANAIDHLMTLIKLMQPGGVAQGSGDCGDEEHPDCTTPREHELYFALMGLASAVMARRREWDNWVQGGVKVAPIVRKALRLDGPLLPSTDREYDPNVAPCDDAEFGMKP